MYVVDIDSVDGLRLIFGLGVSVDSIANQGVD